MLSIIFDHRDKTPHYPWEFSLADLSIVDDGGQIVVSAPNSAEIGITYQFLPNCTKSEFLTWFSQYHSDKFRFMRNFKELRG
jgi:hypothetical protein